MREAKVGWSQREITPPLGLPMGGRGPRLTPGATVLDPLLAQVLAFEDAAGRRALWVSLDLIGMSHARAEPLRRVLADVTGTPLDAVLVNFSHTHSGPMTHFDKAAWLREKPAELAAYEHWLDRQLAALALEAFDTREPASIRWHEGESTIGINRRLPDADGQMRMAPNENGTHNRELWVLHIQTQRGTAIAFAHACHPVIVYGHAWDGLSADYPGQCRIALRERFGAETHCQFFQSFAGNIRPRALADLREPTDPRFRKATPDDAPAVGRALADDVAAALDSSGEALDLALSAGAAHATLHRGEPEPIEHWEKLAQSGNALDAVVGEYWLDRYRHGPPPMRTQTWPAGVMMLDEAHGVVHLGGEAVAEWLPLVRAWLPDRRLMAWGYTQEVGGYLPSDALLPAGGYEVVSAPSRAAPGPAPFVTGLDDAIGAALNAAEAMRSAPRTTRAAV